MISEEQFDDHIKQYHNQSTFSVHLKEVVYGGIDGIVTTFAVVAGFSGAEMLIDGSGNGLPVLVVLLFGLANLFADGLSMGIGDYLSSRAEKKQYENSFDSEKRELTENFDFENDETRYILQEQGISKDDANELLKIYQKYPDFWIDFMMRYELEMSPPDEAPFKGALATFLAFICFGIIPLLPYIFNINFINTFIVSSISAIVALTLLGIFRSKVTNEKVILSIAETVFLGIVAGSVAYGVGLLFGGRL